jgi:integrase
MGVHQTKRNTKDGKVNTHWRVSFVYKHPDGRKERIQELAPINTRRGAEEHERKLLAAAVSSGTYHQAPPAPAPVVPLLEVFVKDYLAHAETRLKASTFADKRNRLKRDVLPLFGKQRLDELGVAAKDKLAGVLKRKGLAATSINNSLGALGSVLRYAAELKVIEAAPPARFLSVPPSAFDFLDFEEWEHLLRVAQGSPWYAALLLAGEAGLRLGEVRALRWCDLNFRTGVLTVRKALWRSELGSPKGKRERSIPMTARLKGALQALRHLKGEFIFCQEDGAHWSESIFEAVIEGLVKRAQLRPIGFQVLRHTFCSHLAMKGATSKAIQELAGHQNLSTTQRYMHLSPAHLREAIGLLETISTGAQPRVDGSK